MAKDELRIAGCELRIMNDVLLDFARQVSAFYVRYPGLRALVVAGSVARGWADEYSDIELDLFWDAPPSDAVRCSPIRELQGEVIEYLTFQDRWTESYAVTPPFPVHPLENGNLPRVKIESTSYLAATVERYISDVVERYDADEGKQLRLAALEHAIPLYGSEWVAQQQARLVPYPDELARRVVERNIELGGWNMVELLRRGDYLLAYDLICKVQKQLLAVLYGLNRMYLPHPRGKWLARMTEQMRCKPPRLAERLELALRGEPQAAVREMQQVIEETFALVDERMPEVDTGPARRDASYRREAVRPVEG